jgi:predicted RNA binding protein YcfA (HicA-like mRNA interferase family)
MGGKYPILTPEQVIGALSKKGFRFKSQRGSHAKYTDKTHTFVVPMHDEVARGTLKSILLQAGIELSEFLTLL